MEQHGDRIDIVFSYPLGTDKISISYSEKKVLSQKSGFFSGFFGGKMSASDIKLNSKLELDIMKGIILFLIREDDTELRAKNDDWKEIMKVADQFLAESPKKWLSDYFVQREVNAQWLKKQLQDPIFENVGPTDAVYELQNILAKKLAMCFKNVNDIISEYHLFVELPFVSIREWIKLYELEADSENTIFFFLSLWIRKNQDIYPDNISELLECVKFHQLRKEYFLDRSVTILKYLNNDVVVKSYKEWMSRCSEYFIAQMRFFRVYSNVQLTDRKFEKTSVIIVQCLFKDVSLWVIGTKYYSSPVVVRGYLIYCFLQIIPVHEGLFQICAFVRCRSDLDEEHASGSFYWPVTYQYTIKKKEDKKYPETHIINESSGKAYGIALTLPGNDVLTLLNSLSENGNITLELRMSVDLEK